MAIESFVKDSPLRESFTLGFAEALYAFRTQEDRCSPEILGEIKKAWERKRLLTTFPLKQNIFFLLKGAESGLKAANENRELLSKKPPEEQLTKALHNAWGNSKIFESQSHEKIVENLWR